MLCSPSGCMSNITLARCSHRLSWYVSDAQVVLVDGRTLLGDLQAFDKQGNLILGATCESVTTSSGKVEERHMGMVLIPAAQRQKVELQVHICVGIAG